MKGKHKHSRCKQSKSLIYFTCHSGRKENTLRGHIHMLGNKSNEKVKLNKLSMVGED